MELLLRQGNQGDKGAKDDKRERLQRSQPLGAGVAQRIERAINDGEDVGSNPATGIKLTATTVIDRNNK